MRITLQLLLLPLGLCWGREEPATAAIKAITAPSEDLTLSFTRPGRLAKVLVREGQHVKAGDLLVQLDDAVERAQWATLKAQADSTTAIRGAQLQLARRQEILRKVQKAHEEQAAPQRELEDAKNDAAMAELALETAQLQHQQDVCKSQEAELTLQRMRLVSPTDGMVERLRARQGESADALAPVLRLVRVDPLWIDVPAPLALARELREGDPATVRLPGAAVPVAGRVLRVSRVADSASETLEVRVELPNPAARPAGEQATVQFPASTTRPVTQGGS
ncbi:MAG: efflux RND transporter periplasmic adaptor subunit [Gemmatimonadales bacterium]